MKNREIVAGIANIVRAILLAGIFLTQSHAVHAASFDCRKANSAIEKAICADSKLGVADEALAAAYNQALAATYGGWKIDLIKSQRDWLGRYIHDFDEIKAKATSNQEVADQIGSALLERTAALKEIPEREKVTYLQETAESKKVCSMAFNKANMRWQYVDGYALDDFTLRLPKEFVEPEWQAAHARLDFYNDGKVVDVYISEEENSHFRWTWFIVALPEEKAEIERRLSDLHSFESSGNFAADLVTENPEGTDSVSVFPVANPTTHKSTSPKLKSRLFDTSATKLYAGWYTRSTLIRYKGATYIVAESLNNLHGPTFAVFKPERPGRLTPQCYFRATPSVTTKSVKVLDAGYPCPNEMQALETPLDKAYCSKNSALIDLKEWGGKRPVEEHGFIGEGQACITEIKVGNIADEHVSAKLWPALSILQGHIGKLLLTRSGPYVMGFANDDVMYYRISDSTLKGVCRISSRTSVPPKYRPLSRDE